METVTYSLFTYTYQENLRRLSKFTKIRKTPFATWVFIFFYFIINKSFLHEFDYWHYVPFFKNPTYFFIAFKLASSGSLKKYSLYYINILKFSLLKINPLLKTR